MTLQLEWGKCRPGVWCPFANVKLEEIHSEGIYVIWHGGTDPRVVYIGQGTVAARLQQHRGEQEISQYETNGGLYVTWASVPEKDRDGVERFLADMYSPLEGVRHPNASPIAANIPWE